MGLPSARHPCRWVGPEAGTGESHLSYSFACHAKNKRSLYSPDLALLFSSSIHHALHKKYRAYLLISWSSPSKPESIFL